MSLAGTLNGERLAHEEGRESGTKRKKLAGYLRAANELRQTYHQSYMQSWGQDGSEDAQDQVPGQFPNVAVARSVEDEMIIFPSYARRHVKRKVGPPRRCATCHRRCKSANTTILAQCSAWDDPRDTRRRARH